MQESVISFLNKHHIQFEERTFLVGVSGGPDSIALLHLLTRKVNRESSQIEAVVINHQLRAEAMEEITYVEKMCEKLAVPLTTVTVDVEKYATNKKVSTQVAARQLRYEVFAEKMRELNADYLALGHHGDDQVETLVMNMARAANSSSLLGIPFQRSFNGGKIIRPLLSVSKEDIIAYCDRFELSPQIDASNEDTSYTRNDIRKNVIPHLRKRNQVLHVTSQYLNETLEEDEKLLSKLAEETLREIAYMNESNHTMKLLVKDVIQYERPLQRRIYRLTLDYLYREDFPKTLSYEHEDFFMELLKSEQNKVIDFPKQLRLEKSYGDILFYFDKKEKSQQFFKEIIHEIPTRIPLPNGDQLSASYTESIPDEDSLTFVLPFDEDNIPLIIRQRQAGDKMTYRGLSGSKKIKDIFIDEKIPRNQREEIYILTNQVGEIIWLIGLKKAELQFNENNSLYLLLTYNKQ